MTITPATPYKKRESGLPPPIFQEIGDECVVSFYGPGVIPLRALEFVQQRGWISNEAHRELGDTTARPAARDLSDLMERGLLVRRGSGSGMFYALPSPDDP